MKDFDFSGLSVEELRQIKERISKEIVSKLEQDKRAQMAKIMDCIKDYAKNYGELTIEFNDGESIGIDEETRYEFIMYENTIIIK